MRYLAPTVVATLAICTSTAHANDHFMRVGEVLLSKNNDTANQYIELSDITQEPFPSEYRLEVYDLAGGSIGMMGLTIPPNTQRFLIATAGADTAFGTTRDATLSVILPAEGQACFARTNNTRIHCVAWGCPTTKINAPVTGLSEAPPDGMSAQIQSDGTFQIAAPTPDAANQAGTPTSPCPFADDVGPIDAAPAVDAASTPDAGSGPGDDDSGCCQVDGSRGAWGPLLLAFIVMLSFQRRRRSR
jgi:hypothetical protein